MGFSNHRHTTRFQANSHGVIHGWLLLIGLLWSFAIAGGCSRGGDEQQHDDAESLRIVSFSPALSRMIVDLGLEQYIVGRTPYCDFLDESIAVVGDLQRVDYERLVDLQPTHVLIQASSGGADQRLLELVDEYGWARGQWSSIDSIEDIENVLRDLPGVLYAADDPGFVELSSTVADVLNEIALELSPGSDELWRGAVLLIYNVEPVGVFGRQTYLNDVLTRLGASNAVAGNGWPNLTLEDIVHLDPQAIVLVKPGEDVNADVIALLGAVGELDITAIRDQRVAILSDPNAMLPSTGIVGAARELREILGSFVSDEKTIHEPAP